MLVRGGTPPSELGTNSLSNIFMINCGHKSQAFSYSGLPRSPCGSHSSLRSSRTCEFNHSQWNVSVPHRTPHFSETSSRDETNVWGTFFLRSSRWCWICLSLLLLFPPGPVLPVSPVPPSPGVVTWLFGSASGNRFERDLVFGLTHLCFLSLELLESFHRKFCI